ncbi:UDP-N-acetyl-D-glucosamine 6-dehydrogenase [compost metagenome]
MGGHCIAVDPWFIVSKTPEQARLIRTAREVNDSKPEWVIEKVKLAVAELLQANPDKTARDVTISCFGLAFKPDIDDLRESPSLAITNRIAESHPGRTLAVEPNISELPNNSNDRLELSSIENALPESDILVLLVDHKEFNGLQTNTKYLIDTRGILG